MRSPLRSGLLILLALLLAAAAFVGRGLWTANLREVVPGRLWRSAQMSPDSVAELVREKGIRLVINLRKEDPGNVQHDREEDACRAAGAQFVTVPLSPKHLPPPDRLRELLEVYDKGPYPALVHCRSGADRAGLASVLYLVAQAGRPLDEAVGSELSWHTGHLPIGDGRGVDEFLDLYRRTSGGRDLRTWILEEYPKLYASRREE